MVRAALILCIMLIAPPELSADNEAQESVIDSAIARIKNTGDPATEEILQRMKTDTAQANPAVERIKQFVPDPPAPQKTAVRKKTSAKRSSIRETLGTLKRKFNKIRNNNMELQGIIYDKACPRAIINDTVVKAGDTVEGAKVVKIDEKSVAMSLRDKKIILKLN